MINIMSLTNKHKNNHQVQLVIEAIKQTPLKKMVLELLLDQAKSPTNNEEIYTKEQLMEIFDLPWNTLPELYWCGKTIVQYALQGILQTMK
jgi:hypothetical protein